MILTLFPLDSNVWGSVADWTVAIAAVVSGVFLYSTLRSQIQVATLSENEYRRSIMPYFLISGKYQSENSLLDVRFTLYQNPAFDTDYFVDGVRFDAGLRPLVRNMPEGYSFSPQLGSKNIERLRFDKDDEDQSISIRFFDVDRNLYEQSFIRDTYDGVSLTYPKLLQPAITAKKKWWQRFFFQN